MDMIQDNNKRYDEVAPGLQNRGLKGKKEGSSMDVIEGVGVRKDRQTDECQGQQARDGAPSRRSLLKGILSFLIAGVTFLYAWGIYQLVANVP